MSLQPTFVPRKPQWRGNTSSEDMNENFEEIVYDLNTIFSEASSLVVDLNELESKVRHELEALSSRVYAVSGLIEAYDISSSGYKMLHEDFYLTGNTSYPNNLANEDKCVVNNELGVVTLPVNNSFSKVYTISLSDGTVYQAGDLSVDVTPIDEDGSVRVEELSPLRAFDGKDDKIWERKVKLNRDYIKDSVSCRMSVNLPSMSNPYVNKIFIKPYPEGTVDITSFNYDTLTSQDNVLPTFSTSGENNIASKMYSFDKIQPSKLKIDFRQRNSSMEDDYKTFVYGAKEIGIENVEYKSSGKIAVRFNLPYYETKLFSNITSLRTNPEYDNIIYKLYLYTSEADFNADVSVWTSSNSPITLTAPLDVALYTTSSIWVMLEMTQETSSSASPLFNSITITYTTA